MRICYSVKTLISMSLSSWFLSRSDGYVIKGHVCQRSAESGRSVGPEPGSVFIVEAVSRDAAGDSRVRLGPGTSGSQTPGKRE